MFRCAKLRPIGRCGGFAAAPFFVDGDAVRAVLASTTVLVLLLSLAGELQADPYMPASDATVLASVPRAELAQRDAVTRLSRELDAAPRRADLAASLARLYIDLHTEVGDPRYLGYADAAIASFVAAPALDIQLVHADLLQARHDFAAARQTLEAIVRHHPDEARAWLMLAAVSAVQGDYAVSRNACARLFVLGNNFEAITCGAEVASLTGRSQQAYAQLTRALDDGVSQPAQMRSWAHLIAADIALRRGDTDGARAHFETGLKLKTSIFAIVGLADLLIDREQYEEALKLLQDKPAADAVILRQAIALQRLGHPEADRYSQRAARRMEALGQRGDDRHAREEAFHALYVAGAPDSAVAAARRNWETQHESIDAQLLLRAAVAAGQPEAAAPVIEWMRQTGSDDVRLLRLARQVEARS